MTPVDRARRQAVADATERRAAAMRARALDLEDEAGLLRHAAEADERLVGELRRKLDEAGALAADPPAPVAAFVELMAVKLAVHADKGGRDAWRAIGWRALLEMLEHERNELAEALEAQLVGGGSAEAVGLEAADVANFAMMIADIAGALEGGE